MVFPWVWSQAWFLSDLDQSRELARDCVYVLSKAMGSSSNLANRLCNPLRECLVKGRQISPSLLLKSLLFRDTNDLVSNTE